MSRVSEAPARPDTRHREAEAVCGARPTTLTDSESLSELMSRCLSRYPSCCRARARRRAPPGDAPASPKRARVAGRVAGPGIESTSGLLGRVPSDARPAGKRHLQARTHKARLGSSTRKPDSEAGL